MRKVSLLACLFVLIGCNLYHIKNFDKFSSGIDHSVNNFKYDNEKILEIEEIELLERKKRLEEKEKEQLENEAKDRYSLEEFKEQAKYFISEYQDKIKRLEKEIEEETLNLNFYIKNRYKRGWALNVYQFHQDEIERLTNEKKENNLISYIQLKDNSIKHHQAYINAIELKFPDIKSRLIERYKANIERYKANIERYKANIERYRNEIKILHGVEKKDLINKTDISKFRAEFDKLSYDNMFKENKNSVEIWKEDIENCQYRITSYEVEYSEYNKLKSEVSTDSLETLNTRLQGIKNSIEEEKLEIKRLENIIQKKELYNKELEEKLKNLEDKK
ncbi:hypothetical protein [Borreliella bavariensis]|uniref:hypothetical protein n=1 Tax=Borreliella bavariensis TaxID=664662 RepID=UPI001C0031CA|nr:hypothetical protein [Borreliella bavariensis]